MFYDWYKTDKSGEQWKKNIVTSKLHKNLCLFFAGDCVPNAFGKK